MNKNNIEEIKEYKPINEVTSLAYADTRFLVICRNVLVVIGAKMPASCVFIT